jgi:F-type H+-transporting ATPase subunit epsilon
MSTFDLTIVTPAGTRFDGPAESLVAPGEAGFFGVLAHHAPMISGLKPGVLKVTTGEGDTFFAVAEGLLEVNMGNSVVVLADEAKPSATAEEAEKKLAEIA